IFYPYGSGGPTITTEAELVEKLPEFSREYLLPHRTELASRPRMSEADWWLLKVPCAWQYEPVKKLVSEYFGDRGSFAYDITGEFVVLQGYAWLWRREDVGPETEEDSPSTDESDAGSLFVPFHQS